MATKPVIFFAFANDRVDNAMYLRNLPKELHGLRDAMQKAVKQGLCEVVERANCTIDNIYDIFQDPYYRDRIAIFHYGGHASGSQLMLETTDGGHGYSYSDGLVPFFARQKSLQLVFFNGCSSQQQAQELVEAGVPAVIGTATEIQDNVATQLAVRFYLGLASGLTLDQSWKQSIDLVKTTKGTGKHRGLKLRRDESHDFPWNFFVRKGAEIVNDWNLPMAADDPLFGLPKLPQNVDLPERPYRFLERYHSEHGEIFFGRSYYIRDVYNRTVDKNASPVILFYGQSGVGKSSMLDAGVLPRLEQESSVKYIRRDQETGLLGTLKRALGIEAAGSNGQENFNNNNNRDAFSEKLENLERFAQEQGLDEETTKDLEVFLNRVRAKRQALTQTPTLVSEDQSPESILLSKWKAVEAATGEPYHILLDQAEEVFTRANDDDPQELDRFLMAVQGIFANPNNRPQGKLILSYRKEYHPEINEGCKNFKIPREEIFLKRMSKRDIVEIVNGLASTDRLRGKYRLEIENGLGSVIADDLLEDKESPIAPVLQILLTKMWNLTEGEDDRQFTIQNYQQLRKEGILMDDFFYQQLDKLRVWNAELEESGLAIDILNFHTTRLGTAGSRNVEDLRERYQHRADELEKLLSKFKELYLLSDAGTRKTGLAHDTLAPLVQNELRHSDRPGQRAFRILENKVIAYEANPKTVIDKDDLLLVEQGANGMRLWTAMEEELIEKSREKRARSLRRRRLIRLLGMLAVFLIACFGIFASIQRKNAIIAKNDAEEQRREAIKQTEIAIRNGEIADSNALIAEIERDSADIAKKEALFQAERALEAKNEAERQTILARISEDSAKAATKRAIAAKNFAELKEKEALTAQAEEALQRKLANEQKIIAEQKRLEAEIATAKTAKERQKAFAISLAGKVGVINMDTIKALMANQAYIRFEKTKDPNNPVENMNDPYVYNGLYQGLKALKGESFFMHRRHASNSMVKEIKFANDKNTFYSVGSDGHLLTWNIAQWREVGKPIIKNTAEEIVATPDKDVGKSLAVSPNGKVIAVGSEFIEDNIEIIFKQGIAGKSGDFNKQSLPLHKRGVVFLEFLDDNQFISAGKDNQIYSYDIKQQRITKNWNFAGTDYPVVLNRAKKLLFWVDNNRRLMVENLATGDVSIILRNGSHIKSLAISDDGNMLAIGDRSGKVHLRQANGNNYERYFVLEHSNKGVIVDLVFNTKQQKLKLAAATPNGVVKVWLLAMINEKDYEPLKFENTPLNVTSLAFTPVEHEDEGEFLLVGTTRGFIKFWSVRPQPISDEICRALSGRDFTIKEWEQYIKEAIEEMPKYKSCE